MNHSPLKGVLAGTAAGALLAAGIALAAETPEGAAAPPAPAPMHRKLDRGPIDLAQANERATRAFEQVDANTDGQITEEELLAADDIPGAFAPGKHRHWRHGVDGGDAKVDRSAETFASLDADGNGQLSAEEFAKLDEVRKEQRRKAAFARMDKDGNGTLSRDEFPPFAAHLNALDTDHDGKVTRDEMRAGRPHRQAPAAKPAEAAADAPAAPAPEDG